MSTPGMGRVERYTARELTPSDPVQQVISQLRANGQEPVVVVVRQEQPEHFGRPGRDQTGLIFVMFMGVLLVVVIAIGAVSCHATPVIHETRVNPNCKFVCF